MFAQQQCNTIVTERQTLTRLHPSATLLQTMVLRTHHAPTAVLHYGVRHAAHYGVRHAARRLEATMNLHPHHRPRRAAACAALDNGHLVPDTTPPPPNTTPASPVALLKQPEAPLVLVRRPLPSVLIIHTGGTLGMDPSKSFEQQDITNPHTGPPELRHGTGGHYGGLRPGQQLHHLLQVVPELSQFAHLDLRIAFNKDSSRVGPREWVKLAKILHANR